MSETGHSYGDFVVDKNATHTVAGSKHCTCANCGDVVTEEIPVIICDVDGDGEVTRTEYMLIRKYLFGIIDFADAQQEALFDMNDDDVVNILDYIVIYDIVYPNGK